MTMTRMQHYEALIILKTAGTEQEIARAAGQLEESVRKLGGQVERSQGMGRRRLAFRIARQGEGHYHLLHFTASTERISELKRHFGLNDAIVRFMIIAREQGAGQAAQGSWSTARRGSVVQSDGVPAAASVSAEKEH